MILIGRHSFALKPGRCGGGGGGGGGGGDGGGDDDDGTVPQYSLPILIYFIAHIFL